MNVVAFTSIYMGKWARVASNLSMSCGGNNNNHVRRSNHSNVLSFLREKELDSKFCASVISGLPKEIMQRYFEERKAANYEPPEFMADDVSNFAALKNTASGQMQQLNARGEERKEPPKKAVTRTSDVFGKSLEYFELVPNHAEDSVPLVFHLLIGYFQANPEVLKTEGLFRVATDLTLVHELEVHIAMRNYSHITTVSSPHIVSNCLKKTLREMITPLNPFYLYDDFMALTEVDRE